MNSRLGKTVMVVLVMFFGSIFTIHPVTAADPEAAYEEVKREINALGQEWESAQGERASIMSERTSIAQAKNQLTVINQNNRTEKSSIARDRTQWNMDNAEFERTVRDHNSKCVREVTRKEFERWDPWCTQHLKELEKKDNELYKRKQKIDIRESNLKWLEGAVSRGTLQWTKDTNENQRKEALNKRRIEDIHSKLKSLNIRMGDKFKELARIKGVSQRCDELLRGAPQDFELTLDGKMEKAHRCLQGMSDGARLTSPVPTVELDKIPPVPQPVRVPVYQKTPGGVGGYQYEKTQ